MIFGLQFSNDSKQQAQFSIDVDSLALWFRANDGTGWTEWRRADAARDSSGAITETVTEATKAKLAETANRFTTPVTVTFTGDVTGTMVIDGSRSAMEVHLKADEVIAEANQFAQAAIKAAIAAHYDQGHETPSSGS